MGVGAFNDVGGMRTVLQRVRHGIGKQPVVAAHDVDDDYLGFHVVVGVLAVHVAKSSVTLASVGYAKGFPDVIEKGSVAPILANVQQLPKSFQVVGVAELQPSFGKDPF